MAGRAGAQHVALMRVDDMLWDAERRARVARRDLDLAGALERPFAGPKMWWELVVTPRAHGPVPELPISQVDELPHADSSYWEGEGRARAAAFTSTGERDYRYAALYHVPQAWERSRASLINAFEEVRRKLNQLENFQRKGSRDLLLDSLKD